MEGVRPRILALLILPVLSQKSCFIQCGAVLCYNLMFHYILPSFLFFFFLTLFYFGIKGERDELFKSSFIELGQYRKNAASNFITDILENIGVII